MRNNFGVKLNYIVILEKLCNNSTLLMELFMICGHLYPIQTIFIHRSRNQLLEFRTSFYETISSELLVQGNFMHTLFSREHWY